MPHWSMRLGHEKPFVSRFHRPIDLIRLLRAPRGQSRHITTRLILTPIYKEGDGCERGKA